MDKIIKIKYMKKLILFFLLTLPLAVMGQTYTWFESPKEVIEVISLKVKEVWSPSEALALGNDDVSYLIKQDNGNFYDDQKIRVTYGQEVRRIGTVVIGSGSGKRTLPIIQLMKKNTSTDNNSPQIPSDSDKVYDVVENMPQFPGGFSAMMKFLSDNIKYPVVAEEKRQQGRVIVTFIVECDGTVTNVRVAMSAGEYLDNEALRVIKSMPRWIPGRQNGSTVRVKYTFPVTFRL
jgi:TonB family protein